MIYCCDNRIKRGKREQSIAKERERESEGTKKNFKKKTNELLLFFCCFMEIKNLFKLKSISGSLFVFLSIMFDKEFLIKKKRTRKKRGDKKKKNLRHRLRSAEVCVFLFTDHFSSVIERREDFCFSFIQKEKVHLTELVS